MAACSKDSDGGGSAKTGGVDCLLVSFVGCCLDCYTIGHVTNGSGLTLDCNAASMCVTPHTDQEEAAHDESTQALALPSSTRVWDFLLGQKKSRYKRATDAASGQLTIWQKCTR